MEPLLRTRDEVSAGIRVGWELLHLLQLSVRSLEDTATRVVAAKNAPQAAQRFAPGTGRAPHIAQRAPLRARTGAAPTAVRD